MIDSSRMGRFIVEKRKALGLTQQQLAGILNVTHQAVSKWENGAATPDIESLLQMSRLFGVTLEQLLQEEMQAEHRDSVIYELIGEEGPAHQKTFRVRVMFDGIEMGVGVGSTKKQAEQNAAKQALEKRVR